jgi:pilus assembly protein CpaF
MLQAMNTGHDGSMSTIHANNSRDALARIENMVLMGSLGLPAVAIRQQIVSALDVIVQVQRMRDGKRRITQITEVVGLEGDVVVLQDLFRFDYDGENRDGTLRGQFVPTGARPSFLPRAEVFRIGHAVQQRFCRERGLRWHWPLPSWTTCAPCSNCCRHGASG